MEEGRYYRTTKDEIIRLLHMADDRDTPLSVNINMDGHLAAIIIVSKDALLAEFLKRR